MKIPLLAACAALALSGCSTFDLMEYANAANELDPGCYKDVYVDVRPLLLPGWVIPIASGHYRKVCNPDQAPATGPAPQVQPLTPGRVVGAP